MNLKDFVKEYGIPYSEMLGIRLNTNEGVLKWFLAAVLYSKPICESSATKTYKIFEEHKITTAEKILQTGWDGLVAILDEGGYTRYDFSTADKLLEVFGSLERDYGGSLNRLHDESKDWKDLDTRLKSLGKGIGEITVSIFLRDMRRKWRKVKPKPSPLVHLAMKKFGIKDLEKFSKEKDIDIVRLETAMLRLAKDFLKKNRKIKIAKE